MKLKGIVKQIVYENPDNLFKVLSVKTNDDLITISGYFASIEIEGYYEFDGDTIMHPKYGFQFEAKSYVSLKHETKDALVLYLSGPSFKGIGKKGASLIVESLGLDALDLIKKDYHILSKIKGISEKKGKEIYDNIINNAQTESIFIKLYSYGLSVPGANKIFNKYGLSAVSTIEENPYILAYDIANFGFLKCDKLAKSMNIKEDSSIRIKEAILYTLNNVCQNNGFTFLDDNRLFEQTLSLLNNNSSIIISKELIQNNINLLKASNKIVIIENRIYPKYLYDAEFNVSTRLKELLNYKINNFDETKINNFIKRFEEDNFSLTREQKNAVINSLNDKISIITGGPGTGKTTILKCVLKVLAALKDEDLYSDSFQKSILLVAPTGKASKRLSIQTGIKAFTIHKALGYDEEGHFTKGPNDLLDQSFVIIDESSMIDIDLLNHLISSLRNTTRIIFVGDANQLPSVGPGNVLSDLINSNLFKVSYLNEIMRQAADSNIIKLSQMIINKNIDFNIFNEKKEVFFYNVKEANIKPLILKILTKYKETGSDFYSDMQVLAPMYSGLNGIDELNQAIQETFNDSNDIIKSGDRVFKVGDKVLQTVNDSKLEIMNGDTGIIKAIQKTDECTSLYIDFDNRLVKYSSLNLNDLTLGYVISIHKSQGSEYKNVIIPISLASKMMLKKKLIYTAITRAKEKVILIGDPNVLISSLYKDDDIRLTSLSRMLNPTLFGNSKEFKETKVIKIEDPVSAFDFIGETNMDSLTPYDFLEKE